MRLLIAAAVFVVSMTLAGIGMAQRTIWAPPPSVAMTAEFDHLSPFAVIPNSTLALHPGKPTIKVLASTSDVFISSGREADILAFVGNSSKTELTLSKDKTKLVTKEELGVAAGFSPIGSDLWRDSTVAKDEAKLTVSSQDDNAILIASNGLKVAPGQVEIVWPIYFDLTLSNYLLIVGLVLFLASVVLFIWHLYVLRRKRGPRRRLPKAPSGPKYKEKRKVRFAPVKGRRAAGRNAMIIPAGLATIALLSGCSVGQDSSAQSPTPSATTAEVAPPVVTEAQLGRILGEVAEAAKKGDASNDKKFLNPRFTGPALNMRTVHYFLRSKDDKIATLPTLVSAPLSFSLPAASSTWPRSVMAVTDEPGDAALPQLIVLQQKSPRENYQVWYTVRLMPGAKIPAVPSADLGAIPVEPESLFLKVPPSSIPAAYGDLINKGASSLSAQLFDISKDEFYKQVSSSQISQVQNLENAKIAFTHKLGDANVISLSTSQAGALVAVYMTDTYLIRPTQIGTAVGVSGQEALILGANGSTRGVRSIYGNMMLFFVPALSETARIQLIGVTQGLVSVRGL